MTSFDRREFRYWRRKAKREAHKELQCKNFFNFDWVFSYQHLWHSYLQCRKGVRWKASVQKYVEMAPLNVYRSWKELHNEYYRPMNFWEFDIIERGKKRHIQSVHIKDRVVQRCLCDYCLVPLLSRRFIYDNGACMKNKGYLFASDRLMTHLKNSRPFTGKYILLYDFSKFFEQIPHFIVKKIVEREIKDLRLLKVIFMLIDKFPGPKGLGLGSQISQILALSVPNQIDHIFKETEKIYGYGRYNDDGYLICSDKQRAKELLVILKKECSKSGIQLNNKKTQIVKLTHGFTYLKARYLPHDCGTITKKLPKKSASIENRKLKKLSKKVENGEIKAADVYQSWQSWDAYASYFHAKEERRKIYIKYMPLLSDYERKGS